MTTTNHLFKGQIYFWVGYPIKYRIQSIWYIGFNPVLIELQNMNSGIIKEYNYEEFIRLVFEDKFIPENKNILKFIK